MRARPPYPTGSVFPNLGRLGTREKGDLTFYPLGTAHFDSLQTPAAGMPMKWIRRVRAYTCTIVCQLLEVGPSHLAIPVPIEHATRENGTVCYMPRFQGTLLHDTGLVIGGFPYIISATAIIEFGADFDDPSAPAVIHVPGDGPYWTRMKLTITAAGTTGPEHSGHSYPISGASPSEYDVAATFDGLPLTMRVFSSSGVPDFFSCDVAVDRYWQFATDDDGANAVVDEFSGALIGAAF